MTAFRRFAGTTIRRVASTPNSSIFLDCVEEIKRWAPRGLVWIGAAGIVLLEWGVLSPSWITGDGWGRNVVVTLVTVLAIGIVELLYEIRSATGNLSTDLMQFAAASRSTRTLLDSARDLADSLRSTKRHEDVRMSHLGLSLTQSWDYMKEHFLDAPHLRRVTIRILVLAESEEEIHGSTKHPLPREIATWCKSSSLSIENIRNYWVAHEKQFRAERRKVQIIVKRYAMLPLVHGFSVSGRSSYHYVSFCRWTPNASAPNTWTYDWGEDRYHKVMGDVRDGSSLDLGEVFDGYFEYLWSTAGDAVIDVRV